MSQEIVIEPEAQKRVVSFGGVNVEVDLSCATRTLTFKVGDPVKILKKKSPYSSQEIFAGVIVGFDDFVEAPSICVLALKLSYSSADFSFITISSSNEDYEMIPYGEYEALFQPSNVLQTFDKEIVAATQKLSEWERKRSYFIEKFEPAFKNIVQVV